MFLLYHPRKLLQRGLVASALFVGVAAWCVPARAAAAQPAQWAVRLDAATVEKGYTLRLPENRLTVVVPGQSLDQPVTLAVEHMTAPPSVPLPLRAVSPIWKITVTRQSPAVMPSMATPLRIVLAMQTQTLFQKQVRAWNDGEQRWKKVGNARQRADSAFAVQLALPNTIIGVFDNTAAVAGKASWFGHRHTDAAASNDFPLGSTLRVTDPETSRSVMVTVRSRGPFVPGRVLDMSKQTFRQLRPLASGIVHVLAELVRG